MALARTHLLAVLFLRYLTGDAMATLLDSVTSLPNSTTELNSTALEMFVALKNERNYDYGLTPIYNSSSPVTVMLNILVGNIQGLSENTMDLTIDVYFRQAWHDHRLVFQDEIPGVTSIGIPDKYYEDIWLPDTFFENGKQETLHAITMENKMFRVYRDGTIVYSQRLRLTLWCSLNLHHFPMDRQTCDMRMSIFRYTADELTLAWLPDQDLIIVDSEMPMFELMKTVFGDCTSTFVTGTFSCIFVRFYFKRQFGFYLTQLYIPSLLIVALSWVSFILDPNAVPARISLGILTILAMTNQLSAVASDSLPKVSYIKSMDVWLTVCMSFLTASVIEFAIVNSLARSKTVRCTDDRSNVSTHQGNHPSRKRIFDVVENSTPVDFQKRQASYRVSDIEKQPETKREPSKYYKAALYVDRVSRVAFPVAFLLFNIIYWSIYL